MKKKTLALLTVCCLGASLLFAGCDSGTANASASPSAEPTEAASEQASESAPEASEDASAREDTAASGSDAAVLEGVTDLPSDLATPNPQFETLRITGAITSMDDALDVIYITDEGSAAGTDAASEIGAVEAEDCIVMNAQTGQEVDDDTLKVGDRVAAYVGLNMTRSIPPQAPCYALFTNLPENGMGTAHYIRALQVTQGENGGIAVLNQNADTVVTIPDDLTIELFDEGGTTSASSIVAGTRLIAWYDMETKSIPAQATATRVMVDLDD